MNSEVFFGMNHKQRNEQDWSRLVIITLKKKLFLCRKVSIFPE